MKLGMFFAFQQMDAIPRVTRGLLRKPSSLPVEGHSYRGFCGGSLISWTLSPGSFLLVYRRASRFAGESHPSQTKMLRGPSSHQVN